MFNCDHTHFSNFVAYLDIKGMAGSTILTIFSALGHYYKMQGIAPPLSQYMVKRAVQSLVQKAQQDTRLPITLPILLDMLQALQAYHGSNFYKLMMKAALTLAFFACMRISEFTCSTSTSQHAIRFNQVDIFPSHLIINFITFKHSKQPVPVVVKQESHQACPVKAVTNYVQARGRQPGPFFIHPAGNPLLRSELTDTLKYLISSAGLPGKHYTSHSLRIGGATHAMHQGKSVSQIQQLGRWKSNAFMKYLRPFQLHAN